MKSPCDSWSRRRSGRVASRSHNEADRFPQREDLQLRGLASDRERACTRAVTGVDSGASVVLVRACPAIEEIVSPASPKLIGSRSTAQHVGPWTAVQVVLAAHSEDRVGAAMSPDVVTAVNDSQSRVQPTLKTRSAPHSR